MTLAFALRGTDGLVLGADSRVSNIEGSSDTSIKFLQVNREIGILTYGLTEVGYKSVTRLVDAVNRISDYSTITKKRIVHLSEISRVADIIFKKEYASFLKTNKVVKEYNLQPDHSLLLTGFIMCGIDLNETNQFKILSWVSPKFQREDRPDSVIAAEWFIPQFLVNNFYYPEMTVEQLKRLSIFLLVETAIISKNVGGQFHIGTITSENGFQQLSKKDIQQLFNENQSRFAQFRRFLLDALG